MGGLVIREHEVSIKQDESVLEICYATLYLQKEKEPRSCAQEGGGPGMQEKEGSRGQPREESVKAAVPCACFLTVS